jgi:hypothetical protein
MLSQEKHKNAFPVLKTIELNLSVELTIHIANSRLCIFNVIAFLGATNHEL